MSAPTTDAPETAPPHEPTPGAGRRGVPAAWRTLALVLAVLVVVGAAGGVWALRTADHRPSEGSVEVGFSRDMVQHHQQAVVMSFLARDLTDDPEVRTLALDLITAQSEEQGALTAWLRRNDVPASSTVPQMAWMTAAGGEMADHEMGADGAAPTLQDMGYATDEQLTALAGLSGRDAEVEYLTLMRAHHVGGTEMIEAYLARGTDDELTTLAEGMLTAQTRETRQIDALLEARGAGS